MESRPRDTHRTDRGWLKRDFTLAPFLGVGGELFDRAATIDDGLVTALEEEAKEEAAAALARAKELSKKSKGR